MPTPVHRPFQIKAIDRGRNPVGPGYGFEAWVYRWNLVDPDGRHLATSARYPERTTIADARLDVLDALDAFGLGDAALRLDPRSVAEAAGAPSDATPPGPRPRPIRIWGWRGAWYWSLTGADSREVGRSPEYPTERECYDSIVAAVAAVYGMPRPIGELIDAPAKRPWWRRWWVR